GQIDVRVVSQLRREQRGHPLKQRAAWIGRKLGVLDSPPLTGSSPSARLQKAVRVGDLASREREPVKHRQPVEPMLHHALTNLPLGRAGPQQHSLKPVRKLPAHPQTLELKLLLQRIEPSAGRRRSGPAGYGGHALSNLSGPNPSDRTVSSVRGQPPPTRARHPTAK